MTALVNQPSPWISALLVIRKQNNDIRICIEPNPLNRALKRDHFCMPTIDDILPQLTKATVFSTIDAKSVFWHCKLANESANLTTFLSPIGKMKFLRLPYGISPASEIFQRKMLEALAGLDGVACIADDILIYGCRDDSVTAQQDHDLNLIALFERYRQQGLKLNKEKMNLNRQSVNFMGMNRWSAVCSQTQRRFK